MFDGAITGAGSTADVVGVEGVVVIFDVAGSDIVDWGIEVASEVVEPEGSGVSEVDVGFKLVVVLVSVGVAVGVDVVGDGELV